MRWLVGKRVLGDRRGLKDTIDFKHLLPWDDYKFKFSDHGQQWTLKGQRIKGLNNETSETPYWTQSPLTTGE